MTKVQLDKLDLEIERLKMNLYLTDDYVERSSISAKLDVLEFLKEIL